jgi:hypothetical protein
VIHQSPLADQGDSGRVANYFTILKILTDPSEDSDSDASDTSSELSTSGAFLQFPDEDGSVDKDDQPDFDPGKDNSGTEDDLVESERETYFALPGTLTDLQKELLRDYTTPVVPPVTASGPRALTSVERLTLQHYIAWKKSNGTVLAYKLHAQVLSKATGEEILSLYSARKLATDLTGLEPSQVDMCPKSCLAYTGEFEDLESCPYIRDGKKCGEPR